MRGVSVWAWDAWKWGWKGWGEMLAWGVGGYIMSRNVKIDTKLIWTSVISAGMCNVQNNLCKIPRSLSPWSHGEIRKQRCWWNILSWHWHVYRKQSDFFPKLNRTFGKPPQFLFSKTCPNVLPVIKVDGSHSQNAWTSHVLFWLAAHEWDEGRSHPQSANHSNCFSLPKIKTIIAELFRLSALCCLKGVDRLNLSFYCCNKYQKHFYLWYNIINLFLHWE